MRQQLASRLVTSASNFGVQYTYIDISWSGPLWINAIYGTPGWAHEAEYDEACVQKALAKMYGCYEHLSNGRVGMGLADLTGGVSEAIYLRDGVVSQLDGAEKQPQLQAG